VTSDDVTVKSTAAEDTREDPWTDFDEPRMVVVVVDCTRGQVYVACCCYILPPLFLLVADYPATNKKKRREYMEAKRDRCQTILRGGVYIEVTLGIYLHAIL
jgi:hypothetical protein